METLKLSLAGVGALTLARALYGAANFGYAFIKPSELPRYLYPGEDKAWALVTGGSDGIGYGIADELLKHGFNVLLHGRNAAKLEGKKAELQKKHPNRQIRIVVLDAGDHNASPDVILRAVEALPGQLTVLINNVGHMVADPVFSTIEETSAKVMDRIIDTNARFPSQLTRALLPYFRAHTPALIMFIGSLIAFVPPPYVATYAGTKAHCHSFAQGLRQEMRIEGLEIEVLGILVANTESASNRWKAPLKITSAQLAKGALQKVGATGHLVWGHITEALLAELGPWLLSTAGFNKVFVTECIRRRKVEREQLKKQ